MRRIERICTGIVIALGLLAVIPVSAAVESVSWNATEMTLKSTARTQDEALRECITWLVSDQILHKDIYDTWQQEIGTKLLGNPSRYAKTITPRGDGFYVTVDTVQVARDLVSVFFGVTTPRLAVCTREMVLRQPPIWDPAVETEMIRSFLEYGFRVVDIDQSGTAENRELMVQAVAGDRWAATRVRETLLADIIIKGDSIAEEMVNRKGFQARVEFKVVETATGRIIGAYADPHQTVTGSSPNVAAKEALQRGANVSAPRLVALMLNDGTPITKVRVLKVRSFSEINGLKQRLEQVIPGANVSVDTLDLRGSASAILEVNSKTDVLAIAAALDEMNGPRVRVSEVACRYIVGTLE